MAEYGVIRAYLEWIATLPWDTSTDDNLDLAHARGVLDEDHYDIEQVKDRILEFLAVALMQLQPRRPARGSILCFVGPPGVGKTSLGRSIARALGRQFERISVGGVRDEAEIRGHRRTYIGALPGTIIRALRDAGRSNPLIMIDEIDKMGADFRGDPSSAMLEVLDPEQNATFRDHYLDLPFDLSEVMFVTTANTLDTVPGPLRDRMEVIQLAGYTEAEKLEIAQPLPGPAPDRAQRPDEGADRVQRRGAAGDHRRATRARPACASSSARSAPSAARSPGRWPRARAKRKVTVTRAARPRAARQARVFAETRRRTRGPGVATGLAWTPVGGEVLFIEATAMPGTGRLTITGQLGDVMKESAQAALSYVRGNAAGAGPRSARRLVRQARHPHPRARRRDPQGRPAAPAWRWSTALVSLLTGGRSAPTSR